MQAPVSRGELAARLPVKGAAVHNDAAQGGTVAADKLCGGMDHYIRAVLDGTDQVRSSEGVVDDQRQTVLMGNLRNGIDVGDVAVGVSQGFQIDGLCILSVHKRRCNTVLRQRMFQQIVASAVDGLLGHDVSAVGCQRLHGIGDCRCAGGHGQRRAAAFQCGQPFFQHVLGGIGQAPVNVAGVFQAETVRRVLTVVKYIGSSLVNRHCPGICCRICLFLSNV